VTMLLSHLFDYAWAIEIQLSNGVSSDEGSLETD